MGRKQWSWSLKRWTMLIILGASLVSLLSPAQALAQTTTMAEHLITSGACPVASYSASIVEGTLALATPTMVTAVGVDVQSSVNNGMATYLYQIVKLDGTILGQIQVSNFNANTGLVLSFDSPVILQAGTYKVVATPSGLGQVCQTTGGQLNFDLWGSKYLNGTPLTFPGLPDTIEINQSLSLSVDNGSSGAVSGSIGWGTTDAPDVLSFTNGIGTAQHTYGTTGTYALSARATAVAQCLTGTARQGSYTLCATPQDQVGTASIQVVPHPYFSDFSLSLSSGALPLSTQAHATINTGVSNLTSTIDWGDGSPVVTFNLKGTHTYTKEGVYTVTVKGITSLGEQNFTKTVTVNKGEGPPILIQTSGALDGKAPAVIQLQVRPAREVGKGDPIVGYAWTITDPAGTSTTLPVKFAKVSVRMISPGTYHVAVTATTKLGLESDATQDITLTPGNGLVLNIAEKGPKIPRVPAAYTFRMGANSDQLKSDRVDPKTITMTVTDETGQILQSSNKAFLQYTFQDPGVYTVTTTASTRTFGLSGTATKQYAIIANKPPVVDDIQVRWVGKKPGDLQYDIAILAHDDDGRIKSKRLDIDGDEFTLARLRHTFQEKGEATITATVIDDSGAPASLTKILTMNDANSTVADGPPSMKPAVATSMTTDPDTGHQQLMVDLPSVHLGYTYTLAISPGKTMGDTPVIQSGLTDQAVIQVPDGAYWITLRARLENQAGPGPWADPISIPVFPVVVPTLASQSDGTVMVSWPPLLDGYVGILRWQKGTVVNGNATTINPTTGGSANLGVLNPGNSVAVTFAVTDGKVIGPTSLVQVFTALFPYQTPYPMDTLQLGAFTPVHTGDFINFNPGQSTSNIPSPNTHACGSVFNLGAKTSGQSGVVTDTSNAHAYLECERDTTPLVINGVSFPVVPGVIVDMGGPATLNAIQTYLSPGEYGPSTTRFTIWTSTDAVTWTLLTNSTGLVPTTATWGGGTFPITTARYWMVATPFNAGATPYFAFTLYRATP